LYSAAVANDKGEFAPPRFIAEGELSRLAKNLRILGFDCAYSGGFSLPETVVQALREDRILLTCKPVAETEKLQVHRINSAEPRQQWTATVAAFSLSSCFHPFSRCLECNRQLRPAPTCTDIPPESVRERGLPVFNCPQCGRYYWEGSHVQRMRERLSEWGLSLPKSSSVLSEGSVDDR